MSILIDLAAELIANRVGPTSPRGLVGTFAGGSLVLVAATVWLLSTSLDPLRQPDWGVFILAGSVPWGAGGLIFSALHLRRSESDRLFSTLCLTSNAIAIAVPAVWLSAR